MFQDKTNAEFPANIDIQDFIVLLEKTLNTVSSLYQSHQESRFSKEDKSDEINTGNTECGDANGTDLFDTETGEKSTVFDQDSSSLDSLKGKESLFDEESMTFEDEHSAGKPFESEEFYFDSSQNDVDSGAESEENEDEDFAVSDDNPNDEDELYDEDSNDETFESNSYEEEINDFDVYSDKVTLADLSRMRHEVSEGGFGKKEIFADALLAYVQNLKKTKKHARSLLEEAIQLYRELIEDGRIGCLSNYVMAVTFSLLIDMEKNPDDLSGVISKVTELLSWIRTLDDGQPEVKKTTAGIYVWLSLIYSEKSVYSSALVLLKKAFVIYKDLSKTGESEYLCQLADIYIRMGDIYYSFGAYRRSLRCFLRSLRVISQLVVFMEKEETASMLKYARMKIIDCYVRLKDFNTALLYIDQELASIKSSMKDNSFSSDRLPELYSLLCHKVKVLGFIGDYAGILTTGYEYLRIRRSFEEQHKPESQKAYLASYRSYGWIYGCLGDAYRNLNNPDEALDALYRALYFTVETINKDNAEEAQNRIFTIAEDVVHLQYTTGKLSSALTILDLLTSFIEKIMESDNTVFLNYYAKLLLKKTDIYADLGQKQAATDSINRAASFQKDLISHYEGDSGDDADFQNVQISILMKRAINGPAYGISSEQRDKDFKQVQRLLEYSINVSNDYTRLDQYLAVLCGRADLNAQEGHFSEAVAILLPLLKLLKRVLAKGRHDLLVDLHNPLVDLIMLIGSKDKRKAIRCYESIINILEVFKKNFSPEISLDQFIAQKNQKYLHWILPSELPVAEALLDLFNQQQDSAPVSGTKTASDTDEVCEEKPDKKDSIDKVSDSANTVLSETSDFSDMPEVSDKINTSETLNSSEDSAIGDTSALEAKKRDRHWYEVRKIFVYSRIQQFEMSFKLLRLRYDSTLEMKKALLSELEPLSTRLLEIYLRTESLSSLFSIFYHFSIIFKSELEGDQEGLDLLDRWIALLESEEAQDLTGVTDLVTEFYTFKLSRITEIEDFPSPEISRTYARIMQGFLKKIKAGNADAAGLYFQAAVDKSNWLKEQNQFSEAILLLLDTKKVLDVALKSGAVQLRKNIGLLYFELANLYRQLYSFAQDKVPGRTQDGSSLSRVESLLQKDGQSAVPENKDEIAKRMFSCFQSSKEIYLALNEEEEFPDYLVHLEKIEFGKGCFYYSNGAMFQACESLNEACFYIDKVVALVPAGEIDVDIIDHQIRGRCWKLMAEIQCSEYFNEKDCFSQINDIQVSFSLADEDERSDLFVSLFPLLIYVYSLMTETQYPNLLDSFSRLIEEQIEPLKEVLMDPEYENNCIERLSDYWNTKTHYLITLGDLVRAEETANCLLICVKNSEYLDLEKRSNIFFSAYLAFIRLYGAKMEEHRGYTLAESVMPTAQEFLEKAQSKDPEQKSDLFYSVLSDYTGFIMSLGVSYSDDDKGAEADRYFASIADYVDRLFQANLIDNAYLANFTVNRAHAYFLLGRYGEGLNAANQSLNYYETQDFTDERKKKTEPEEAFYFRALILWKLGDWNEALKTCTRSINNLRPYQNYNIHSLNLAKVLFLRGKIFAFSSRKDKALMDFEEVRTILEKKKSQGQVQHEKMYNELLEEIVKITGSSERYINSI